MIRFHFMGRENDLSPEGIINLSEELDQFGYYSLMLTYDPLVPDNLIKCAYALNKNHKIKYMQAIRTYSISPEYMGMICRAFDEIQKDRLMLNIVSGDINSRETFLSDSVFISKYIDTPENRLVYTDEWIKKFLSLKSVRNFPEIVMGGHSEKTIEISNKNNFTSLVSWSEYKKPENNIKFSMASRQMVSLGVVIRDTYAEAKSVMDKLSNPYAPNFTVFGSRQEVKDFMIDLYNGGISDIQITNHMQDDQYHNIHDLVKEIIGEING